MRSMTMTAINSSAAANTASVVLNIAVSTGSEGVAKADTNTTPGVEITLFLD